MTKRILTISLLLGAIVAGSSAILPKKENGPVIATSVIEVSVKKSFALLEKSGYLFTTHSALKCASCHNNTLTALTADLAGQKGMPVTDSLRVDRVGSMVHSLKLGTDPNVVNSFLEANFIAPYVLVGLGAENYPADFSTDICVDYILSQARPGGGFLTESG